MIGWIALWIISLIIIVVVPYMFFLLGQKDKRLFFFSILNIDLIPLLIALIYGWSDLVAPIFVSLGIFAYWLSFAFVVNRVIWSITLKYAADEDELAWFYLVYYVPLIGWIIYQVTH